MGLVCYDLTQLIVIQETDQTEFELGLDIFSPIIKRVIFELGSQFGGQFDPSFCLCTNIIEKLTFVNGLAYWSPRAKRPQQLNTCYPVFVAYT